MGKDRQTIKKEELPNTLKVLLAKSIPSVVLLMMTPPTGKFSYSHFTLAHYDAVRVEGVNLIS